MEATGGARRAGLLLAWLVAGGAGLLMTTQAFGWTGTRLVAITQSLTPHLVALMAPVALVALVCRGWALGATASLVGLGGLVLSAPLVFPPGQAPPRDGARGVEVASVNLLYTNDRVEESADALLAQDADVIVFSEYTAEFQRVLRAHRLADGYAFRVERDGLRAGGAAVWSRFPLRSPEFLDTTNYSIDTVVDGPDGPFALVGVHPPAPIFDFDAWRRDHDVIRRRAETVDAPTIVVGDFNASFWHPPFRDLLDTGLVDAHTAHGEGFSASWPTGDWRPAFVRLDHALTGGGLVSTAVADFDVPGSDHRGFVVTVAPTR